MAPPIATASITLTYPIYAADFDPNNKGLLLVGGGGGEGRSGVGNKITLLDTTRKQTISEVIDIDLSRDEDSVTSLAIAQSSHSSGVAFAGINSSTADRNAGKNEHLRSFELQYPRRKKAETDPASNEKSSKESGDKTTALGRASLFTPGTAAKKEAYQRVLRLSPANSPDQRRLAAAATSLEPKGEIVIFDASKRNPTSQDVLRRIRLGEGEEAADLDIISTEGGDYSLAYCTDYEVYVAKAKSSVGSTQADPLLVYKTPYPDASSSTKVRPKFRGLRVLQPNLLLLLQNKVKRGGAELMILELPSSQSLGTIILRKSLRSAIKAATALSTCQLPAPTLAESAQSVVAVAGQDNSITILTLDHPQQKPIPTLKFRSHAVLRDVHPNIISCLTFADFKPPSDPKTAPPQYIKLASTSIEHTVVVHTLPLTPYPPPSRNRMPSRYVLTPPGRSEATQITFSVLVSALVIAVGAFLLQAFTEIRGGTPEYLGAKDWLSDRIHGWIARPYMFEDAVAPKVVQSQATEPSSSTAKPSIRIPGVDDLRAPGIEPHPIEGLKSVAAEVTGTASSKIHDASESVKDTTDAISDSAQKKLNLRHLLSQRASSLSSSSSEEDSPSPPPPNLIIQHDETSNSLTAALRDDAGVDKGSHRKWEELAAHEREVWKRRLVEAGEWAVEEGEAVLKGVVFGNVARAVGEAVGRGMG